MINAERFKEAVDTRVAASKRAVEFYLARAKTLETQLRAAEEEKRRSRQEADKARLQLEKLLSEATTKDTSKLANITPEASIPSAVSSAEELKKIAPMHQEEVSKKVIPKSQATPAEDPITKRQKEAIRFFQEKA